jgi:excinuclease UvrABC helicase subunit UvrB
MNKLFDELFNDFFNDDSKHNIDDFKKEVSKMIESLKSFDDISSIDDMEKEMEKALGEPDEIEYFEDRGLFVQKRIWHTLKGDIIKMLVSDIPFEINIEFKKPVIEPKKQNIKSLEQQLQEAVNSENFEEAARIRDIITPKKKVGRPKKIKINLVD